MKTYETKFMEKTADNLVSRNWCFQHPVLPMVMDSFLADKFNRFQNLCNVDFSHRHRGSAGHGLEQRKHPGDLTGNVG